MKICMINGSPKLQNSTSSLILKYIENRINAKNDIVNYHNEDADYKAVASDILSSDVLVVAFPLYADGIPSNLLPLLQHLEKMLTNKVKDLHVYVVVNNGFYEAKQNELAIAMMKAFCIKIKAKWGQGIAIGGGPLLNDFSVENGPMAKAYQALAELAKNIQIQSFNEDVYIDPGLPRFLYIFSGNIMWRRQAKNNRVSKKAFFGKK